MIGSLGGRKSRRALDPETARNMVRAREANRARLAPPPPHDTHADAERVRLDAIRRLEPARRLKQALDLSETARTLALVKLRTLHKGRSDRDLMELLRGASHP